MAAAENAFCDLLEKLRSWIPRRADTPTMSRDFWMPDQSCRVCYECDSPFNLFNRRHHCRICGRVFCGKCTQNTLAAQNGRDGPHEEGERVRVCNFCFKLRQEDDQTVAKSSTPSLTPSSSSFSLASSTTSGSSTSSSSSGNPGQMTTGYGFRAPTTDRMEPIADKKQRRMTRSGRRNRRSFSPKGRESSPNPYDFCSNRSDGEEDDRLKIYDQPRLFEDQSPEEEEDDSCVEMEFTDADLNRTFNDFSQDSMNYIAKTRESSDNILVENAHLKREDSVTVERTLSRRSGMSADEYEGPEESVDESNFYTPSLLEEHASEAGEEPVDVENNPLIWLAPAPEDEDDETGLSMVDDDDDDEESGWGSLTNSEYRSREKAAASDEQRKAMRAVVDGHFRALVQQLLDGEGLEAEENEGESWLEIVTVLSLQAASLVKPDTSKDGGMDPGGYVKVKCIAAGRRSESCVIKGVVCKRNVAHRRMTARYKIPRLLLLGGALEYQRVTNQLSSLDTLLQQEKDHLSMTVSRIEALHPNVVLVEKTVSRQAQERLLAKDISLVLNVKRPLLERIARCTGAEIVPAPEHLTKSRSGHCENFHVEKYVEELGSAGQGGKKLTKTLMFFEGCPRPLGCTVLLKGASGDELKKVKRVVQYAVFAAYQLALETSFLVDEGATLPELPFKSPISVALPDKQSKIDRSISIVPGFLLPAPGQTSTGDSQAQPIRPLPSFTSYSVSPIPSVSTPSWGDIDMKLSGTVTSVPWSMTSSCVSSRTNSPSASPRVADIHESPSRGLHSKLITINNLDLGLSEIIDAPGGNIRDSVLPLSAVSGFSLSAKKDSFENRFGSFAHQANSLKSAYDKVYNMDAKTLRTTTSGTGASLKSSSLMFAELDGSGMGKTLERSDSSIFQDPQLAAQGEFQHGLLWEDQDANHEEFPPSPSDHQSILVSFSSSCLRKRTVCERGHVFRIKYYGSFDKPLGRFLRDNVFDLNNVCGFCEERRDAHVHCYMHRQGSLTISVHRQTQVLTGEMDGKIWMWHRCLKCPRVNNNPPATHRVVMSDAAWGLSFGKFLELSFSNYAAASRVAACGHSLHRDCLRFYGFGSKVACFRYAPINVHSVYLPPSKLEFNNPELYDWLKDEVHEVTAKGELIFAKAFDTLSRMEMTVPNYGSGKVSEVRRHIAEYETFLLSDKGAFEEMLQKAAPMKRESGHLFADILELNSTRRSLAACSLIWNRRLHHLSAFLKLQKPPSISVSSILDDPSIVLRNKNITSVENLRSLEVEEKCNRVVCDSSSDWVNAAQLQTNGVSNQAESSLYSDVVQSSEQVAGEKISIAKDLILNSNDNTADPYSSTYINHIIEDATEETTDNILNDCKMSTNGLVTLSRNTVEDIGIPGRGTSFNAGPNGSDYEKICTLGKEKENNFVGTDDKDSFHSNTSEDDLMVRRTLSEGPFLILSDLSDTFEAVWTGKGHTVEAHAVTISSNGQEIVSQGSGLDTASTNGESHSVAGLDSSSEVVTERSSKFILKNSTSAHEISSIRPGVNSTSTPTAPPRNGDWRDDLGDWIGTPFSSLYRSYSQNAQNLLTGSLPRTDGQWISNPFTMPLLASEARISLPLGIDDIVIPVYNDEPTSIIAYAIMSHQYQAHLSDGPLWREKVREKEWKREKDSDKDPDLKNSEEVVSHPLQFAEGPSEPSEPISKDKSSNSDEVFLANSKEGGSGPLQYSKSMHVKVSFSDSGSQGKVKYSVTCYYAKQFDALRKKCCPDHMEFVRSLCRCKKWGAQGGKSNVFFAKTSDDRFVIKQVTKTELESFIKFAPEYFKYLSDALTTGSPTCLAKILGMFQVTVKQGKGGKEVRMDLMAMENLLYGRHVTRLYDLKGSVRSRYNADVTGKNKVLLDENLLESMLSNPIFIGNKAKRILERAVWNDTSFLASVDVMDYSLLVGVDEERRELVLGIIDFVRQYTWDKHLETWVKASGILGGPKNAAPTVISPKQYKKRFRKAMATYFLMVPDQWSPPTDILDPPQSDSATVESSSVAQGQEDNISVKM